MAIDLSKATPRPWRLSIQQDYVTVRAPENDLVAQVFGHNQQSLKEANAAVMIAAVNSFEAARELAQMIITLSKEDFTLEFGLNQKCIAAKAQKVLRLMEGE